MNDNKLPAKQDSTKYTHKIGKWIKVPGFNTGNGNFIPRFRMVK